MVNMKPHFFSSKLRLRYWFKANHDRKDELIVGYYKKNSGIPSVTWEESVDEALCFGWIDSIRRSIDEKVYVIRFTPRRNSSKWSAKNINRVEELIKLKLMHPAGLSVYKNRKEDKPPIHSSQQGTIRLDEGLEKILRKNKSENKFFNLQAASYRKLAVRWVMTAKRPETRLKRLNTLIKCSETGELIPPMRWGSVKLKIKK
jgi:uncharacterized protein YdeI (YjbR/CyaY-like superfamily)